MAYNGSVTRFDLVGKLGSVRFGQVWLVRFGDLLTAQKIVHFHKRSTLARLHTCLHTGPSGAKTCRKTAILLG